MRIRTLALSLAITLAAAAPLQAQQAPPIRVDDTAAPLLAPGPDAARLAQPLSWLHHNHLAPECMRPRARADAYQAMDLVPADQLDRRAAMVGMPPLIKAYLRLGGQIGDGAWIDHDFNTPDVFLLLDTKAMSQKHRKYYETRQDG